MQPLDVMPDQALRLGVTVRGPGIDLAQPLEQTVNDPAVEAGGETQTSSLIGKTATLELGRNLTALAIFYRLICSTSAK